MSGSKSSRLDLCRIRKRVKQKRQDYIHYDFSRKKNDILKTFFDLAQEFDTLEDLYRICVSIPLESLEVDSRLYILNVVSGQLELVCDSQHGVFDRPMPPPNYVHLENEPYESGTAYFVPIYCKSLEIQDSSTPALKNEMEIIGIFEVFPVSKLTKSDKFFFTKYTNRIGYNLRKKMLARQNIQHLRFIKNLVSDIEHNVIIPNMYFRHLFNQLKRRIHALRSVRDMLNEFKKEKNDEDTSEKCLQLTDKIDEVSQGLWEAFSEIDKHHVNCSLFLESLFRRDHFEKGRFVLRSRTCKLDEEIIVPQLENYAKRFASRGIAVERPQDMIGEEILINADLGLLAQVYANLFSNAVKYTQEITTAAGRKRKAITYGRTILYNYFGVGKDGIKLNVFSTGEHIRIEHRSKLFMDGFQCDKDLEELGTGHGLSFIKYVIEIHGGEVGYEPTEEGNNFFFILPLLRAD